MLNKLNARKAELLEELAQIEEQIKLEEIKAEKATQVKQSPKAKFFFKVGEKHPVLYRTKETQIAEIVKIDLEKNFVWVNINGTQKKFVAEPLRNKDNKITTFAVTVDKRTKTRITANSTM